MYSNLFSEKSVQDLISILPSLPTALWETFYVTVLSTALSLVIGLPLGVLLVTGEKDGVLPLPGWLMHLLNIIINLLRSIPFLILMIMVLPLSRALIGTAVGTTATIVPLAFRAVSKVEEIIPEALKQNVAVKTFPDLNALILSGDRRDVARVETFLRSVDKPVPMVTMEILIADVTKSKIHEIGVGAGVGDKAVKTSGTLSPGVDMTFSSGAVNDLLGRIRGTVNLGRVTPNFYLSLQALEEDGVVRLLSTPKLSTLNGHEATLTSGETQYYKEVQNNYYGTQNPISSESYQWKSVDANLSIKVTPYVSEDRQITLEIEFEQTEFTDRAAEDAPPGTATRSFKSIVKVQNEEMVLLGGLDRNTMERSSRGVPFLARVPVIKWFFGKEKRNKVERTLNIFIKPTVVE